MLGLRPRLLLAIPLALCAMAPGLRAVPAHADYGRAIYQIAISENCDNASICGGQLGGFWGWGALYSDGTGDAQFAGCGHTIGGGGPFLAGASHEDQNITWVRGDGPLGPGTELYVTSETDTFTGHGTPQTMTIPHEYFDTGVPLVPGHYNTQDIMGFTAPGVSFQIQVTYVAP